MRLPTFVVIGAAKAGTTSIQEYLEEHPGIFMPKLKPNYFAYAGGDEQPGYAIKTLEDYRALYEGATDEAGVGDVSEAAVGSPHAAERMHELIPDAQIVVVLRNPVERAFSGYMMHVRGARESRGPLEAFKRDTVFVEGGFYYERLKRFTDRFAAERIQVHLFEDFSRDTLGVMQAMFGFVGADPTFVPPSINVKFNTGFMPKSQRLNNVLINPRVRATVKWLVPRGVRPLMRRLARLNYHVPPSLPPEVRAELTELYREDVERLQELIRRDLSHWTRQRGDGSDVVAA